MAELKAAAKLLGLDLEGVRFDKRDTALDRPVIAFLKDAKGGHFAILRPVGTTGTMVQVIDPPHAPWITDYERLFASKPWMGRILVPSDPWIVQNAAPLIATGGLLLLVAAFWHRLRSARVQEPEERPLAGPVTLTSPR